MQPVRIYLARHGQTDWNLQRRWQGQTDVALNALGRRQAVALGRSARGLGIERVVSSDLVRATLTAELAAKELGVAVAERDGRWRERGFGVFEGLTREQVSERYPDAYRLYQADRRNVPARGESFDALTARLSQALLAQLNQPTTLVVTHGGCMRSLWALHEPQAVERVANGELMALDVSFQGQSLQIHGVELLRS